MHYLSPSASSAHVVFFYRNFQSKDPCVYKHIGLGVSAMHAVRVLRKNHVRADLHGVWEPVDIDRMLGQIPTCTHAVIEAPWVPVMALQAMMAKYPNVHFVCRCHSQIGFLQVEAGAVKLIRDYLQLQDGSLNFTFSGNSERFAYFIRETYRSDCLYLPNLYDADRPVRHHHRHHPIRSLLRIGSFGAIRLLKNHSTAAAAALLVAKQRQCDLEFHMTVNREENGAGVLQAIRNMFSGVPGAKLIEVGWQPWANFRHIVAFMDLCIQISSTETFNIVTADACAEGVPSVVSAAIEWLPHHWVAHIDDVEDVARVATRLLSEPRAGVDGTEHLERYASRSIGAWLAYLGNDPRAPAKARLH